MVPAAERGQAPVGPGHALRHQRDDDGRRGTEKTRGVNASSETIEEAREMTLRIGAERTQVNLSGREH